MTTPDAQQPADEDTPGPGPGPGTGLSQQAHAAYQARMPFRVYVAFPGNPGPYGEATEERVELMLVRGLDAGGERVYLAFGPAGYQLPPIWRPLVEPLPEPVEGELPPSIRFEIGNDGEGRHVFLPLYRLSQTNN